LDSCLLLTVVGLVFGFTITLHPEYSEIYDARVFHSIISGVSGISGYIIIRQLLDTDLLRRCLKSSAYVLFLYYFLRSLEVIRTGVWTSFSVGTASNIFVNSSMEFGYSMLFPVLLFLYFYLMERRIWYLVISLVGFLEIVLYGGRGPILAYMVFIAVYVIFIWIRSKDINYKGFKIFGIILAVALIYLFFDDIVAWVVNVLGKSGIESRALTLLIQNEATSDNGRNLLYMNIWGKITDHSLWTGYGPLSDMYYLDGYYAHNIILELMVDFGLVPGMAAFAITVFSLVRTVIKCVDRDSATMFLVFVSCGFVKLFFSSSFWTETLFWMMLALMVNYRRLGLTSKR
jgi:hypothetical protein